MNILTPEQIDGMRARDVNANEHTGLQLTPTEMDRRLLLRDREAICERLECEIASLEALKDGCMAGLDMSVSDNAKALAKANAFQHSADRLRALLSELRGGK